MNLYLISQTENQDYDTYDSAIVAAENEDKAKLIHPAEENGIDRLRCWERIFTNWCKTPNSVKVKLIGTAINGTEEGVIITSYNAG